MTILWRHPTIGRNGPRLGAPGDVPKRTGDTAPPRPVAPVSTVAPASSVAPVSIMAMAPIAPMASILLPQNSRDDGRGWCRAGDARTKANGAEPQCANRRSSGRNLRQEHCQNSLRQPPTMCNVRQPKFMPHGRRVGAIHDETVDHAPAHALPKRGTNSASAKSSSATRLASATAAATPHGRAARAMRRRPGRRSTRTARRSKGLRPCGSRMPAPWPTSSRRRGVSPYSMKAPTDLPRCARTPAAIAVVCAAAGRLLHAVGNLGDALRDVSAGVVERIPHRRLPRRPGGGRR